jgi:hypothetical protein
MYPSSGQFPWSCTRSLRRGFAPGRGNSRRRGCVYIASKREPPRAATSPPKPVLPLGRLSWSNANRRASLPASQPLILPRSRQQ